MKERRELAHQHYSEKGGHLLRGCYWKAFEKLLSGGDFLPDYRALLTPVPAQTTWQRRRFMPRHGISDGRR